MWSTGDFGDAGIFYLQTAYAAASVENGRVKISGSVVQYDPSKETYGEYVPVKSYTAYFAPGQAPAWDVTSLKGW